MKSLDTSVQAFSARYGAEIWHTADRRFALFIICALPVGAGVRLLQVHSPLDAVLIVAVVLWLASCYEYWSVTRQQTRSLSGAFLPVMGTIGFLSVLLGSHPSSVIWAPLIMLFAFVRMPYRQAQALSIVVGVASLAIPYFYWQVDAYWISLTFGALAVTSGAIVLFIGGLVDTLRMLDRTAELLNSSVRAMTQGIMIAGPDGRVEVYNEQACNMLNLSPEIMRGRPSVADLRAFQKSRGDVDEWVSASGAVDAGLGPPRNVDDKLGETPLYTRRTPDGRYLLIQTVQMPSGDSVRTYTDVTSYELINRQLNTVLQDYGEMRKRELRRTREQLITALSLLSRHHDNETGQHILRTQIYLRTLANELARSGQRAYALDERSIDMLVLASPMHDLGKIGIADHILNKRGRLSPDEIAIMHTHASIGESTLATAAAGSVEDRSLLLLAARIAGSHHENWDGSGYPKRLAGEQIPLEARLMSLADVYDALTTPRVYKPAWTHEEAASEIRRLRGIKFDPAIVDAFEREEAVFRSIAQSVGDPGSAPVLLEHHEGKLTAAMAT